MRGFVKLLTVLLIIAGLNGCHPTIESPGIIDGDSGNYSAPSPSGNIWESITEGFTLDHYSNRPEVQAQIKWFMSHQDYLQRVALRATPYAYYVLEQVKDRAMPTEIALLPIVESAYDPFLYSNAGAAGLWQFMPGTASGFKVRQDWWYDGRRDVYDSTKAALNYLLYLADYFNGDWYLALAAYNSGQGAVSNAIRRNEVRGLPTDFWHLKLPLQTRAYVPKLLALAAILDNPEKYPVDLPAIPNTPYLAVVTVGSQIDLQKAANYAGITTQELYTLNPGYNKWATDPNGPHKLIIPVENVQQFKTGLAAASDDEQLNWKRYQIRKGDSLEKIAAQHNTNTQLLEKLNGINRKILQVGQAILIPIGSHALPQDLISSIKHYLHTDENVPGQTQTVHIVHRGETLQSIARKYKVKPREIAYWNQLDMKVGVHVGQEITIWSKRKRVRGRYYASQVRPYVITYTVVAGDTLPDIASRYYVSTADIRKANQLASNTIQAGQMLTIPPSVRRLNVVEESSKNKTGNNSNVIRYKIRAGDTLSSIAKKYHVTPDKIRNWNNINKNYIRVGQVITIYR